jgi:formate dehydrogenase major subunit
VQQKNAVLTTSTVSFTLNGEPVVCRSDQTIIEVADQHGIEIPRLCYMEGMRPDGNCRTCMVEIKGERVLAPSCCRFPTEGMTVTSNSARALTSQKMSIELLLSDVPETAYTLNSELDLWAKKLSIGKPRFASRRQPVEDISMPAFSAIAACAPAVKNRSMTSSVMHSVGGNRRLCSTWTIKWATPPALPVVSVCRHAQPAR